MFEPPLGLMGEEIAAALQQLGEQFKTQAGEGRGVGVFQVVSVRATIGAHGGEVAAALQQLGEHFKTQVWEGQGVLSNKYN